MSAAEDDLARALDVDETGAEPAVDGAFTIDTLDKATWALRRIGLRRRRLAEVEAAAAAERARIDDWVEAERARAAQGTAYLEALLRRYHEQRITEDNPGAASWDAVRHSKTIHTPAGDLAARKLPDTVDVDETVFVPWAITNAVDLLNPPKPRTPAKARIKDLIGEVMSDGTVVDKVTGQFIPGVTLIEGDIAYRVVTPEAGQ